VECVERRVDMKCCYVLVLDYAEEVSVPARGILKQFRKPETKTVTSQVTHQIHEPYGDDDKATEMARVWKKGREQFCGNKAIRSVLYQEVQAI
jgi:hypothetical protein